MSLNIDTNRAILQTYFTHSRIHPFISIYICGKKIVCVQLYCTVNYLVVEV